MRLRLLPILTAVALAYAVPAALYRPSAVPLAAPALAGIDPDGPGLDAVFDQDRMMTMDADGGRLVLYAAGDIANCDNSSRLDRLLARVEEWAGQPVLDVDLNDGMIETADLIARDPEATVLALGDLVYDRGEPWLYDACYDPSWGRFRDRTWPTPGNHDYGVTGARGYYGYWGPRAGPDDKGYYAIRAGTWLLLSLNSETDAGPGSEQAVWLQEQLDRSDAACVMAFYHRPAFSTVARRGPETSRALFTRLAEAGVSLVLTGHNHFYERTEPLGPDGSADPAGTQIFVVGTGGTKVKRSIAVAPFDAAVVDDTFGVLRLELNADGYAWEFLDAVGGTVRDDGARTCG